MPRDQWRKREAEQFRKQVRSTVHQSRQRERASNPLDRQIEEDDDESEGGGGFFGGLKDFAGDVVGGAKDVGKSVGTTALDVLDIAQEHVGAPAFGVLSGATAADRFQDPRTGQWYREKPSAFDIVGAFGEALTRNPVETYQEGKSAYEEMTQNPEYSVFGLGPAASRTLTEVATDPLLYVGPGTVGRLATKLPRGAVRTALTARRSPFGAVAEGVGAKAAPLTAAGAGLGTELGERSGLPHGETVGGLLGGLGAGMWGVRRFSRNEPPVFSAIDESRPHGGGVRIRSAIDPTQEYEFEYRVVDMDEVTTSHDPFSFAENENFPQRFQNRRRDRPAEQQQVIAMAQSPDANRLTSETYDLQNGIPIMGPDGIIESGNGRTMALMRAAQENPEAYDNYVRTLMNKAQDLEITPDEIADMERPILVRQRVSSVSDREAFVREANEATTMGLSPAEQALSESALIPDEQLNNLFVPDSGDIDMALKSRKNAELRRAFLRGMSETEAARLVDQNGQLNQAGLMRLKAAMFAKTFPGPEGARLVNSFFESTDEAVKNVQNSLASALPRLSRLESMVRSGNISRQLAIADDLSAAVDTFAQLKSQGITVPDFLQQSGMFGMGAQALTPRARSILQFLDANNRAPKQLREALIRYADEAMNTPNPSQMGMFGDVEVPTPEGLWARAAGVDEPAPAAQAGFDFEEPPAQALTGEVIDAGPDPMRGADESAMEAFERARAGGSDIEPNMRSTTRVEVEGQQPVEFTQERGTFAPQQQPVDVDPPIPDIPGSRARDLGATAEGQNLPPSPGTQASMDAAGQPHLQRNLRQLQQGEQVRVADRQNLGTVVNHSGDTVRVHFRNKRTGMQETKNFRRDQVTPRRGSNAGPSTTRPENPREVGGSQTSARLGEPPRQMEGTPPPPPGGAEPPLRGRGQNQPFGTEGRPLKDLLDARDAPTLRRLKDQNMVFRGPKRLKDAFGRMNAEMKEAAKKVDPVIREKKRVGHNMTSNIVGRLQIEHAAMRRAGLKIQKTDDDTYHLFADGHDVGLAEDVIERTSDMGRFGYQALTAAQKGALEEVARTNQMINETLQRYGVNPRIDDGIDGDYWGRVVLSRQYENLKGQLVEMEQPGPPTGTSRSVGVQRIKQRTHEAIEDGIEAGLKYDDPWDARAVRLRGKLMMAEDAWLKEQLGPLGRTEGKLKSTVGLQTVKGHPAFNQHWFTPEVAKRIQDGLDRTQHGPLEGLRKVNSVLTPLRSSFDLSATFQQGLRLWLTRPDIAAQYWWTVMRSLQDATVYDGALLHLDDLMRQYSNGEGGLEILWSRTLHPRDAQLGTGDNLLFPRQFTEKVKGAGKVGQAGEFGLRKSNEAFSRTLTLYSHWMAVNQYKRLKDAGLQGQALDDALRESMRGVNRMFGWTDTEPTSIENAAIFAPRYTRAGIETVALASEALVKNATLRGASREAAMARNHVALMLAEGAGAVWLLNEMRGYDTDFDPRSSNFLRIRNIGGLDVTPFGSYNTLFRAIGQATLGQAFPGESGIHERWDALKRLGWGKMSPAMRMIYEPFIEGSTYLGEPLDPLGDPLGVAKEFGIASLPFGAQGAIEEGLLAAGVQSFGISGTPVTPAERRDMRREELAQQQFGKPFDELSGTDKSIINEDEEVQRYQQEVNENTLSREDDRSASVEATLQAQSRLDALSQKLETGEITGDDFRDQYHNIQAELRGSREVLDLRSRDDEIDGWFELYDEAEDEAGILNRQELETLQEQYIREHPDIEEKVDRIVGTRDNQTLREFRKARELATEYYSIPAFRGMSLEESRAASAYMQAMNTMVSYGYARDRQHAMRLIAQVDPEAVGLIRQAEMFGRNPARERWRFDPDHALFHKFYGQATTQQLAQGSPGARRPSFG